MIQNFKLIHKQGIQILSFLFKFLLFKRQELYSSDIINLEYHEYYLKALQDMFPRLYHRPECNGRKTFHEISLNTVEYKEIQENVEHNLHLRGQLGGLH